MLYDPQVFTIYEGLDRESFILATYYMEAESRDLLLRSAAIAIEQSTGTWTAVPEETRAVKEQSVARVIGVHEIPGYEDRIPPDRTTRQFIIQIAYPVVNVNGQIPELLTTLFGNISMIGRLKLMDVQFPKSFVERMPGPQFGIEGVRKLLNVYDRPLLVGMYKPCVGAPPQALGKMFFEMALGGIDVVKDDELLADPEFCTVEARLEESLKAKERAKKETGREVLYCINITDSPSRMYKKALKVIEMGGNALMVNTYTVGFAALSDLASDPAVTVPIMTHPAFAGSYFEASTQGVASNLILGKLPRMAGSDLIIYPSPYGKVPLVRERGVRVAHELTCRLYDMKATFPGPAAGMHPGLVPQMMGDFGVDVLFGAGGGIHGHPQGTIAGCRAFHQAFEATLAGNPLREAAKNHKELSAALDTWGVYGEPGHLYALAI
jgi:2,3-diketo-5-methylthiopentyl-1-phosphate enolase